VTSKYVGGDGFPFL